LMESVRETFAAQVCFEVEETLTLAISCSRKLSSGSLSS
jgi:hypothetical protein